MLKRFLSCSILFLKLHRHDLPLLILLGQLVNIKSLIVFESFVLFIVLLLVVMDILEILLSSVVLFLEALLLKLCVDFVLVLFLIQLSLSITLLLLQHAEHMLLLRLLLVLLHLFLRFVSLFKCLELLLHHFVLLFSGLSSCCSDLIALHQTLDCFSFHALSQLCNPSFF